AHLDNLLTRAESSKHWTEKILKQTEVIEEFLYEKLDKKVPTRMNNHELLGQSMIDSGNEFGPGTAYGNALIKCGETEKQIGGAEREFIQSSAINFLTPFRNFLEGDFKTILKERKLLQNKRLDLDAAKTKLKKAKMADARALVSYYCLFKYDLMSVIFLLNFFTNKLPPRQLVIRDGTRHLL
uniref:Endophilin-B1-like n=1 Tax=Sinocyclocheilus grahami TaxID=75366 RepID=A0A672K7R7_SINGR